MLLTSVLRDLLHRRTPPFKPVLSVVVNFHNNVREAPNTLHSLSRNYQKHAHDLLYEVIALDHGSTQPLAEATVRAFGPEFHYRYVTTESVSPVAAINEACREAIGDRLLVMIDGAHILTPGILRLVGDAFERFESPFVATVPLHLGPQMQNISVQNGYDQQVEDRLLGGSDWKRNGYRLFGLSGSFADDSGGWYGQLFESGCFAMRKADFLAIGGFDERFQSRGGGLTSLDFFQRALATAALDYVVLLGEGSFHQFHGGVATNAPLHQHPWQTFHQEYARIRGHPFVRVPREPHFVGEIPPEAVRFAEYSEQRAKEIWGRSSAMSA